MSNVTLNQDPVDSNLNHHDNNFLSQII